MKMNPFEITQAKRWLATIPFKNSNNETFLRDEDSCFHPNQMENEDVISGINLKYKGGVKGFKKDLAMNRLQAFTN
jgi:hypothetical protein